MESSSYQRHYHCYIVCSGGLTYENLGILRLKKREKFKRAFGLLTVLTSIYIFSSLGIPGKRNNTLWWTAVVGSVTLGIAAVIEAIMLRGSLVVKGRGAFI